MPMRYKIDIIRALKEKGYNTTKIYREKLLSQPTLQRLRNNEPISWANIEKICLLLDCQPGDILEIAPNNDQQKTSD